MAFCNSCGATLTQGTKFCNKCGAVQAAGPSAPAAATPPAAAPTGGSSALKIILIVVAVIVGIGILGIATVGIVGYRIAKSAHVTTQGNRVKVDTPMGSFSANDPDETVKELGVEVYPGAQVQKEGTATATFGSIHTVAANFETSDPLDKVCDFYKSKFPGANVTSSQENHCSIVSGSSDHSVTINIEATGSTTKINIASVSKKSTSSN